MTEDQIEDGIVPEVLPVQQLSILINEGNLEPSKGQFLIEKFADHFKQAAEWAKKAKSIIVTDESQTVNMKMARTGRLFLRDKRLEIENMRKLLKADALKECQVIDRIAHFLKDVIIPTEEHLLRQERFVEMREEAKAEALRLEVEARMEQERLAKEKADAEELEKLRKAQAEHEKVLQAERQKAEHERRKAEEARLLAEGIARTELAKQKAIADKAESELRAKKQAEMKAEAEKLRKAEQLASAGDYDKLMALKAALEAIVLPDVKSQESKVIVMDVKSHLGIAILKIKPTVQNEEV